jgi:hypothetical protein
MQNNWDLQFAMTIETDEEQGIVSMLEEVIRRLKNGEGEGRGNYCYGVYEFSIVEWIRPPNKAINPTPDSGPLEQSEQTR